MADMRFSLVVEQSLSKTILLQPVVDLKRSEGVCDIFWWAGVNSQRVPSNSTNQSIAAVLRSRSFVE